MLVVVGRKRRMGMEGGMRGENWVEGIGRVIMKVLVCCNYMSQI